METKKTVKPISTVISSILTKKQLFEDLKIDQGHENCYECEKLQSSAACSVENMAYSYTCTSTKMLTL